MREFFKEIFKELKYRKGDVFVVKVLSFFKKTKFLLASKSKDTHPQKARPVVVFDVKNEELKFIATSTFLPKRSKSPKFPMNMCVISQSQNNCFGIEFNAKFPQIFFKKTQSGKRRYFYPINIHIFEELEKEDNLRYCGHCSEEALKVAEENMKKFQ